MIRKNLHYLVHLAKSLKISITIQFFICTQSHVAFKHRNNGNGNISVFCIFPLFWTEGVGRHKGCKYFFRFIIEVCLFTWKWGILGNFFDFYKYLRNQGSRKRCKTNVNFQFVFAFLKMVSCRMEQFMKKGSIFSFCCCSILWKKKRSVASHWVEPCPRHFFSFFFTSVDFSGLINLFCV